MATKRISALTAASAAALTDQLAIEDVTNATKKLTAAQLAALIVTGATVNAALGYTAANAAALNASALTSGTVPLARLSGITNTEIAAGAGIVDTKLATISTPGKVANGATTATSANTASAIVARDASGDFAGRNITATQFLGGGAGVTGLDAAALATNYVPAARLGDGNAHEVGGLAALGSMWLGAPPVSLAIARGGTGLATSITVNGIALTVTRPSAAITRIGGLATAPAFTRASVANNPETGAAAISGAARYASGQNLVSAVQSNCSASWNTQADGANATWAYNGSEIVCTVVAPIVGEAWAEIRLNGARWSNLAMIYAADVEITGHTAGSVAISIFDTVSGVAASSPATIGTGNVNSRYSVTRTLRGNLDNVVSCIRLRVTLPAGTNAGTVLRIRKAQFEFGSTATTWVAGGDHAILIERGTTNSIPAGREDFSTSWSVPGGGGSGVVTPGQADPFGGTSAYKVVTTGGAAVNKWFTDYGGTYTNGIKYSFSVWMKVNSANSVQMNCNLPGSTSPYITSADGWKLVKVEGVTGNGLSSRSMYFDSTAVGNDIDITVMWPQIEEGARCSSYTAAGTTRQPDSELLPAVCNPAEGTVIVRAYCAGDTAGATGGIAHVLFDAWSASTTNRILLAYNTAGWTVTGYGALGAAAADRSVPGVLWTSALGEGWHVFAFTYRDGVIELWVDGTKRATSAWSGNMPTSLPNAVVGSSGYAAVDHWDNPIDTVAIYDRKLTDAELTALTAPTLGELPAHPAESFRQTYEGALSYTARVVDVTSASGLVTAAARATALI